MTKILVIAALTVMSASAYASKSRVSALNGSYTAKTDVQNIFTNPAKMHEFGELATIEYGATALGSSPNAEGGFIKAMGDAKLGFYLGRQDSYLTDMNSRAFGAFGTTTVYTVNNGATATNGDNLTTSSNYTVFNASKTNQTNPFDLLYSAKMNDLTWAASLYYSNSKIENLYKSNATILSAGVVASGWNAYLTFGLGAKDEADGSTLYASSASLANATVAYTDWSIKSDAYQLLGGEYDYGSVKFFGSYLVNNGKMEYKQGTKAAAGSTVSSFTVKKNVITLGAEDKMGADAAHFFYGAAYVMTTSSTDGGVTANPELKMVSSDLPFWMGVEADVNSWMTLRTSLKQTVLLGNSKQDYYVAPDTKSYKTEPAAHNTTAALGAGFKIGKAMLDMTLAAGTNGQVNTATLGTNASLTYNF
jgi:hypothetical protein